MLRINFYAAWLPEDELPLLVRDKVGDARLEHFERELTPPPPHPDVAPAPQSIAAVKMLVVAVGPFSDSFQRDNYRVESQRARDMQPGIAKRLIAAGLARALALHGLGIESDPVGFSAFDPRLAPDSPMPDAVALRKGAQFRVDHLVVRGRRIYGFFITPVTRLYFTKALTDDEVLGRALVGERVHVHDANRIESADLLAVDFSAKTARVVKELRDSQVPLEAVQPRATTRAVTRYFDLLGRSADARLVRLAPQIASYRLLPNGQRNRRWLSQQYEFVSSWLLSKSESGRLKFQWPQSPVELYVQTEALRVSPEAS